MPPRMTNVAYLRGIKNALICGIGSLCIVGILTLGIMASTGRTLRESVYIAFAIFWFVIFIAFVLTFFIGRAKRGAILLDCGEHPTRTLFWFNAVLFAIIGLSGGFASNALGSTAIASALFGLSFSVYWIFMSTGRLQIVENGIWQYWSLLKWKKIASYEWQGDEQSTLLLQTRTTLPFLGRGALPVPTENKEAVSELLAKYVSQQDA